MLSQHRERKRKGRFYSLHNLRICAVFEHRGKEKGMIYSHSEGGREKIPACIM